MARPDRSTRVRSGPRWRRRLLLAGLVVAALTGGACAAGAWYFSDQIHDALVVTPAVPEQDLVIAPASPGNLTVRGAPDASWVVPFLRRPRTWGVAWEDGYGQIAGRPLATDATEVTMPFRLLRGAPPAAGTRAALRDAAFPTDAASTFAESTRMVTVRSDLGPLPADLVVPAGRTNDWAILVHGLGDGRDTMFRLMRSTVAAGYSSLDISYRNDEGAVSDPTGTAQMGRTEWTDLAAGVRFAQAHGARRIVLCGSSMGAAIVAAYLRHRVEGRPEAQGPDVAAVVLDSPMLSFDGVVDYDSAQYPVPVLDVPPPPPLTSAAKLLATWRFGIDWTSTDYLRGRRWATMPVLVEQGTADTTVPPADARRFADLNPAVQLVLVPGAEHEEAWNEDPAGYDRNVRAFLSAHASST